MDAFTLGSSDTSESNFKSQATFKILRRLHGHNLENQGLNNLSEAFQNFVTRAKFFSIGKLRRTWSHSAVEFMKYRRLLPMIVGDEYDQGSVFDQFIDIGPNGLPSTVPNVELGTEERRIVVSNVSAKATKTQLQSFFNKFGKVQSCHIASDKNRNESTFYATMPKRKFHGNYVITFKKAQYAQKARKASSEELIFYGQQIVVKPYISSSGRLRSSSNQNENKSLFELEPRANFGQLSRTSSSSSLASTGTNYSQSTLSGPFDGLPIDELPERVLPLVLFHVGPINRIRLERVNKRWLEAAAKAWSMCHNLDLGGEECNLRRLNSSKKLSNQQPMLLRAILRRCGPHLRTLNLSGLTQLMDEKTISDIGTFCPNLVELDLTGISATPETLRALTESTTKLTKLAYCNMAQTNERTFWFMFRAIAPKIKSVNLSGCIRLRGTFFKLFGTELETLLLDGCILIDDNVIEDICARCNSIRTLKLDGCKKLTDASLSLITRHLPELNSLSLCGEFTNCSAKGFYQISRISSLQKLCLDYNPIVDNNLLIALANGLPQLCEISLAFCGSDNSIGVDGLAELAKLNRLIHINLSGLSALKGEIIEKFCTNCPELQKAILRNCIYLNNLGVEELGNLGNVEHIDLSGCILVSNESIEKLCHRFKRDEKTNNFQQIVLVIGGTVCEPHKIRIPRNSRVILDHFDKSSFDLNQQFKWMKVDANLSLSDDEEEEEDDFKFLSAHRDFIAGALQTEEEPLPGDDPKLIAEWVKKEAAQLGLLDDEQQQIGESSQS